MGAASVKLQAQQRRKRDKKRVKRLKDSKKREKEMKEGKEWNEEEQQAAVKLQTLQRQQRDRQRVQDIKEGKRSAFELILVYKSGSARITLTIPDGEGNDGTFKVEKAGSHFNSGTFVRDGKSVSLPPEAHDPLVIECNDEQMDFAVQGVDNWLTQA